MTNEELADSIQKGDKEHILTLWGQCEKLIRMKANACIRALTAINSPILKTVDTDDLIQSGFFAMLEAVKYYDPESGCTFLTFLNDPIKTAFNEAMGRRTPRQKKDPGNTAVSVDAPALTDEDGCRIVDLIPDPKAEEQIDRLAEDDFIRYLHDLIHEAISETDLTEKQKQVLMVETSIDALRTLPDRLAITGCKTRQRYDELKHKAYRHLQKNSKIREAWEALCDLGSNAEIASASLSRSPEAVVIMRDKHEQRIEKARRKVKREIQKTIKESDIIYMPDEELSIAQREEEAFQAQQNELMVGIIARMVELKNDFAEKGIWYPSLQQKFAEYGIDFPPPAPPPPPETMTADPPETE